MYTVLRSNRFKKSYKKLRRSGQFHREDIERVIKIIASGERLPAKYEDHGLGGEFSGFRECHIRPDLLLIYKIEQSILVLQLIDIGSHSELFG